MEGANAYTAPVVVTKPPSAEQATPETSEYTADGEAGSDDINLEEVLGGNIRKSQAVAAAASEAEAEAAVE